MLANSIKILGNTVSITVPAYSYHQGNYTPEAEEAYDHWSGVLEATQRAIVIPARSVENVFYLYLSTVKKQFS